jgi:hypothetical protein
MTQKRTKDLSKSFNLEKEGFIGEDADFNRSMNLGKVEDARPRSRSRTPRKSRPHSPDLFETRELLRYKLDKLFRRINLLALETDQFHPDLEQFRQTLEVVRFNLENED